MGEQQKRKNKVEDRKTEITQSEQQTKKRRGKNMSRASETCGTITKGLMFVILKFQKEKEERWVPKRI